jgi:hypothetical protein
MLFVHSSVAPLQGHGEWSPDTQCEKNENPILILQNCFTHDLIKITAKCSVQVVCSLVVDQKTHQNGDHDTNFISSHTCEMVTGLFCERQHDRWVIHSQRPTFKMCVRKTDDKNIKNHSFWICRKIIVPLLGVLPWLSWVPIKYFSFAWYCIQNKKGTIDRKVLWVSC